MNTITSANEVHFSGGQFSNIVNGPQITTNTANTANTTNYFLDSSESILEFLAGKAAINALHDSEQRFPPPNCLPGTRAKMLEKLGRWIEDRRSATKVHWLNGPVGVGKSAIAQTLTEKYAKTRVAASFFFSRTDPTRNKLEAFVATIAYQLITNKSLKGVLCPHIEETIREDPTIFEKSIEHQFQKLILEPCLKVDPDEWESLPGTIVVDGIDECIDIPSQERLLAIFREACTCAVPVPFTFLLCSRPEPRIRHALEHRQFRSLLDQSSIGESDESSRDIRVFLQKSFADLREKHCQYVDSQWPSNDAIDRLVTRSCGQFIFVATVIKYIDTHDDLPSARLETILHMHGQVAPSSPYPDLDLLYHQILSTCPNWDKVCPILRILLTDHTRIPIPKSSNIIWRSPFIISQLLGLEANEVRVLMSRLHSVLYLPDGDYGSNIQILHASFSEFLSDHTRSECFHVQKLERTEHIDCVATTLLLTLAALQTKYPPYVNPQISTPALLAWENLYTSHSEKSLFIYFASRYWTDYCIMVKSPSTNLLAALDDFDPFPALTLVMNQPETLSSLGKGAGKLPITPWKFVNTLTSIFQGFTIAFHPGTSLVSMACAIALCEWALANNRLPSVSSRGRDTDRQIDTLHSLYSSNFILGGGHEPLLISADQKVKGEVKGWTCIGVTNRSKSLDILLGGYSTKELLVQDVMNGTYKSAGSNLKKFWHLWRFKCWINGCAQRVGLPNHQALFKIVHQGAKTGCSE
ncbi:nwd2 [Moniliophthora roreri MCA 2997]|uniref:Nwd2 n=1 Tax=Moniliophthora roreri (strain MCA 2997) TaxID=1381753 RepID=V2WRV1_MONRO|nr:nwd2 [Moniliophthora roreri MCA 2997]